MLHCSRAWTWQVTGSRFHGQELFPRLVQWPVNLVGKSNEYVIKGIMFSPLFLVVFVLWVCNVDKISWPIWPTTFRVIADTDIAFESVSKVIQNVVVGSRRGHTCSLFKFQLIHYRLWSHLHIHSRGKTYANTHVVLLKIAFKNMNWNPLLLPVWNLATITITISLLLLQRHWFLSLLEEVK